MKHLVSKAFVVVLSFLLIFSCENSDNTVSNESPKTFLLSNEQIAKIGEFHNQALEKALVKMKSSKISLKTSSRVEVLEIASKGLNEFYETQLSSEALGIAVDFSKKNIAEYKNVILTRSANRTSTIEQFVGDNNKKLSKRQVELFLRLSTILKKRTDLKTILQQLQELRNLAIKTLSREEAQPILIAVEVAKSSCFYWHENMAKWIRVLADSKVVETKGKVALNAKVANSKDGRGWFCWGEVVESDAAGAITGGLIASSVNIVPGYGQVGYCGAVGAVSSFASSRSAIDQLFEHYDVYKKIDDFVEDMWDCVSGN